MGSNARFDDTGTYRYELSRSWHTPLIADKGTIAFLMLNPSTADVQKNDPTVTRCIKFADTWGYGAIEVLNLFALRSTDPKALYGHPDPVGPDNDRTIAEVVTRCKLVICAWGNDGKLKGRGVAVYDMLVAAGVAPMCLEVNANGHPKHPLYTKKTLTPIPFARPAK